MIPPTSRRPARLRTAAAIATSLLLWPTTLIAPAHAAPLSRYASATFSEVPVAVSVANDGTIAVALHDSREVALINATGSTRAVALECSPNDVELDPLARYAWAVCQEDSRLWIIDVAAGAVQAVELGLSQSNALTYVPDARRLLIADMEEVMAVAVTDDGGYQVLAKVAIPGLWPIDLSATPDARYVYASTDNALLRLVDMTTGKASILPAFPKDAAVYAISLSPLGTVLYAGAIVGPIDGERGQALLVVNPKTGAVLQTRRIDYSPPAISTMELSAGYRTLYFATGSGVVVEGVSTGEMGIPINRRGRFSGQPHLLTDPFFGAAVARSAEGGRVALGDTSDRVKGLLADDTPYAPSVSLTAYLGKSRLILTGGTSGIVTGARVRVYVKDLTVKRSRFRVQTTVGHVAALGAFRWSAPARSRHLAVYVTVEGARSRTVTVG